MDSTVHGLKPRTLLMYAVCLFGIGGLHAQQLVWKQLAVDATGAAVLEWQWQGTPPSGAACEIYYAAQKGGVFTRIASLTDVSVCKYTHLGAQAQTGVRYYFVRCAAVVSDTLQTLFMGMDNQGGGVASLAWVHPRPDSNKICWFRLYRRGLGNDLVDSTTACSWRDTVTVCGDTLAYVLVTDMNGCRYVSPVCKDYYADFTAPDTARLDSVSLHPERHDCTLGWQPSASPDVFGYIVYCYEEGIWKVLDTLYGASQTHYVDTLHKDGNVWQYRIASIDTCRNASPLGEIHHTLKLSATVHKCDSMVDLSWNPYHHFPGGAASFEVFARTGTSAYAIVGSGGKEASFTCRSLDVMQTHTFFVRVWNAGRTASSTTSLAEVVFHRKPGVGDAYVRSVSVDEQDAIEIQVYVNDTVDYRHLILERRNQSGGPVSWSESRTKTTDAYRWVQHGLDVRQRYEYRAVLTDECDYPFAYSLPASNIVLTVEETTDGKYRLSWPSYEGFGRSPDNYAVYRRLVSASDFQLLAAQPAYSRTYEESADELPLEEVRYRVSAKGGHAALPYQEECFSNTVEVSQMPTTYIPNSFVPESDIEANRVFKPVNVYVDATEYTFTIFDRWGQIVFETHRPDEGWDGNIKGRPARMGIYVYQLTYRLNEKKMFSRRGMVNLIR